MLTIRGRLITPFVLGSMSVGLNILIRHSSFVYGFMSLDYGFGTMTATTTDCILCSNSSTLSRITIEEKHYLNQSTHTVVTSLLNLHLSAFRTFVRFVLV